MCGVSFQSESNQPYNSSALAWGVGGRAMRSPCGEIALAPQMWNM